ncbi:hypothetical protein D0Z08_05685 [Nocardioides immobilis]|uniref:DUF559 domain-containing protein n=1 Tax=Nocardioides immobilis TaxID=2049295 RepID=A0A417Y5H2_9ACTN|nr:hypothetical protein [Nocardioides immobilis]RHW27791.1 hypothetical protein D0Z08_05685 [Nocardioides immobilis]
MPDPSSPFDTRRPFSRADAIAAGIDPKLLRGSGFRRIFRGVLVDTSVPPTPELRVEAALVPFHASAYASHASAARVHRLPIPTLPDEHVTVLDPDHRRTRSGIRCHVAKTGLVRRVRGIRVSDYAQTFVELAETLSLVDLVIVGDNLVRKGKVTPEKLIRFCRDSTLPGAQCALDAARYVREGVDSPMETRLRMLIVLAGLPEPKVNLVIRDEYGHPVRRYDLWYEKSRTLVEYDGRQHIEREQNWESDLERREEIDDTRARILVVTAKGVHAYPERTLLKVQRVLRERGEPGVPTRLSDAWRPHFPGYH